MSATVSTPVIAVEVVEKKVRVPTTLPAKYGKFIQFGYFIMNKLNACDGDEDTPPLVDEKVFLNKLRIFESLEDQQAFVQEFLDSSKQINDELRKIMLQRKREIAKAAKDADKPKKEKKPRQIKEKKSEDSTEPTQPVEKKSRAKKAKVTSTEDALVNELVQLAEGTDGSPLPPPSKKESAKAAVSVLIAEVPPIADPVKETKTKETKPKVAKEEKPKVAKEEKPKVVKESKPKVAKEEKPKSAAKEEVKPTVTTVAEEKEEEDEEELQVSIFMYEGQQYLIDDLNNVYDFTSQDKIGTLVNDILIRGTNGSPQMS